MEEVEGKELEELWTSTCIFITLFLLSVSYGATVTVLKVGPCTSAGGSGRGRPSHGAILTYVFPQVKWVFSTPMQDTPQTYQDYANILQTRA